MHENIVIAGVFPFDALEGNCINYILNKNQSGQKQGWLLSVFLFVTEQDLSTFPIFPRHRYTSTVQIRSFIDFS